MAPPVNTDPSTAVVITSLPYSISQRVDDSGTTYDVWYTYTPLTCEDTLSLFAFGDLTDYQPRIDLFTGPLGTTPYMSSLGGTRENLPILVPFTPGTQYWFQVVTNGDFTPSNLTFEVEACPQQSSTAGAFLVNDDTTDFPAVIINTVGATIRSILDIPAGESLDNLSDGTLLVYNVGLNRLDLFSPNLAAITNLANFDPLVLLIIRTNRSTNKFWVGSQAVNSKVRSVSSSGVYGGTTYTLTGHTISALALKLDESIIYYGDQTGTAIKTWITASDSAGADFAAAEGGFNQLNDLLVLSDGTVVAFYLNNGTGNSKVKWYDSSGVLINSITLGISNNNLGRLGYSLNNPTTFIVWWHPTLDPLVASQVSQFIEVTTATGVIVSTVNSSEFETGVLVGEQTPTPASKFGNSFSCGFVVLPVDVTSSCDPIDVALAGIYVQTGTAEIPARTNDELFLDDTTTQTVKIPNPTAIIYPAGD